MNPSDFPNLSKETAAQIKCLCSRLAVEELLIFGSYLRSDFDPAKSDIDILVTFRDPEKPGIADRFLELAEGLESAFGRPVDLLTRQGIRNPVFRRVVESTARSLYAA